MPRKDGTGPMGMGAKTGRGAGYCNPAINVNSNQAAYFGGNGCGNYRRCIVLPICYPPFQDKDHDWLDD